MKKVVFTLLTLAFAGSVSYAQSLDDGIKFLYYERNTSARETLEKVVASNPKDAQDIYWLGQALLADNDVAGAKALYQKALTDGVNDPWIWVGSGEIELLQNGDINSAKQKFEQAITATTTKGRKGHEDADILNAIGRANAAGSGKQGDPAYGVDVLKRAQLIDTKNPDIDINLGICYLKMGSDRGGDAVQAFTDATVRDPKYAKAYYRIGKIYQNQDNVEYMNLWYAKAIAADPNYGPVYLAYFKYYEDRDINAAKENLDKWVANSDQDCQSSFFVADYLYRAGKFQESLDKINEMANGTCKSYWGLGILYAYNYEKLGDSAKTIQNLKTFFTVADSSNITPEMYVFAGKTYGKVPGMADTAAAYYIKAMNSDTLEKNKYGYIDSISGIYKRANMPQQRLYWVEKGYHLTPDPSNREIFDLGDAAYNADSFPLADSMFAMYRDKYPDQAYGYYGLVKTAQKEDSTGEKSVIPINDYIGFLMKDTTTNAAAIGYYHAILGGYYANTAKNLDSSIMEFQKALQYDPTNAQYTQYLNILNNAKTQMEKSKSAPKSSATKPKPTTAKR